MDSGAKCGQLTVYIVVERYVSPGKKERRGQIELPDVASSPLIVAVHYYYARSLPNTKFVALSRNVRFITP